jgi:hypothetical protein
MKTYYFIKSILPYLFLPLAPGVVQVELARQGLLSSSTDALIAFFMQVVFTLGIIVFLARTIHRRVDAKAFLRMSCVSKKVFYNGKWMSVEQYLSEHHNVVVSHGMTPEESEAWLRESEEYLRETIVPADTAPDSPEHIIASEITAPSHSTPGDSVGCSLDEGISFSRRTMAAASPQ